MAKRPWNQKGETFFNVMLGNNLIACILKHSDFRSQGYLLLHLPCFLHSFIRSFSFFPNSFTRSISEIYTKHVHQTTEVFSLFVADFDYVLFCVVFFLSTE